MSDYRFRKNPAVHTNLMENTEFKIWSATDEVWWNKSKTGDSSGAGQPGILHGPQTHPGAPLHSDYLGTATGWDDPTGWSVSSHVHAGEEGSRVYLRLYYSGGGAGPGWAWIRRDGGATARKGQLYVLEVIALRSSYGSATTKMRLFADDDNIDPNTKTPNIAYRDWNIDTARRFSDLP